VCKSKKDKKIFFSYETYTRGFIIVHLKLEINLRTIVIDLIIVKLFGVCLMVFPFKEKWFST